MPPIDKMMEELIQRLTLDEESHRLQRDLLELTEEDVSRLKVLHPHLSAAHPHFIDNFYQHLLEFEEPRRFLQDEATVEYLKKAQAASFNSLTSGIYDKDYISNRLKIGLIHHSVGLSLEWYLGAYAKYLSDFLPRIQLLSGEFLSVIDSLLKVMMFDMGLALDIQKHVEIRRVRNLAESAENVLSNISDGILVLSGSLTILSTNQSFLKQFEFSTEEEVVGHPIEEILQSSGLQPRLLEILREGGRYCNLLLSMGKVGKEPLKLVQVTLMGMRFDKKESQALLIIKDLSEEERLKRLAEGSERRFRRLAEVAHSGIILVDSKNQIIYFNGAAEKMFGVSRNLVLERSLHILLPEMETSTFSSGINSVQEEENQFFETQGYRGDGAIFSVEISRSIFNESSGPLTTLVVRDLTRPKQFEDQLLYVSNYDTLTGLPNRIQLIDRVNEFIPLAKEKGEQMALLFLDLDRFKGINDSMGHASGDILLVEISKRLSHCLRKNDTLARFGGDEFVILLKDLANDVSVEAIAEKILDTLAQSFEVDQIQIFMNGSIGISIYPQDGDTSDILLRRAEAAMYWAKEIGNSYVSYSPEIGSLPERRFIMERDLRLALEREEFELFFQPQIDLQTGTLVGAEALIRWRHPEKGLVLPEQFISMAESTGLIVPIGAWVIRAACNQIKEWKDAGLDPVRLTVNVSVKQFERGRLTETFESSLKGCGVEGRLLEMEVTESVLLKHSLTADNLRDLLRLGIRTSIDDFGTGYSSLSTLKKLPVYKLKIDRSFVTTLPEDPDIRAITAAIITMAAALRLKTIAEGVETQEQFDILKKMGCDEIQGYYFSVPLPNGEFLKWVQDRKSIKRS
jgi:diguanylate cyclase (GGDEF)-like protein/PAS domain S-box-containing protein